jgi:acetate kinase
VSDSPPQTVVSFNGGSSSLKFAAFASEGGGLRELARGSVDRITDLGGAVPPALEKLTRLGIEPDAVGHRIVHGGPNHLEPTLLDGGVIGSLREATPFAPLHLPGELAVIDAVRTRYPRLPQVACFDTAFHARMPLLAKRLPLPSALWQEGVRRYGFHGLSYESIVETLGSLLSGRVVIAHLGNGASMVALSDGEPRETTMGFTPAAGLVMGTRTGDLDPGVAVYLARNRGMDPAALEDLFNRRSGLRALSETTNDMLALLAARPNDPRADLAVATFCWSARKWIGALTAVLGGLDALVFTGGIGQHAAPVREEICRGLEHLGIDLDSGRNARSEPVVSAEGSRCMVRVVATDEERVVARHTAELTGRGLED